ncbi:MAG TPA: hypothetical protein DD381_12110 [Lentisphaeria bacterium]|nr:MAG: hypothetical protein A2X47_09620 [Lentisphaerae bacterium GWF2_38_69]HBM17070.1 hypothetical protein [Lentisphaeria bacterium]
MKKLMFSAVAAMALILIAGCSSVKVVQGADLNGQQLSSDSRTNVAHISASSLGLYGCVVAPLVVGSAEKPGSIAWFSEDATQEGPVAKMVTTKAKELGATSVLDLQSQKNWIIPIIPGLLNIYNVEASGNAVK